MIIALAAVSMFVGSSAPRSTLVGAHASLLASDPEARPSQARRSRRVAVDAPRLRSGFQPHAWRVGRHYRCEPAYSRVCRTEYRTRFDPYAGDYVSRPVRVCREGYGSY